MENKIPIQWQIPCTGILILGLVEVAAMHYGINGTVRTIIFSMIALIVGIQMPQIKRNI